MISELLILNSNFTPRTLSKLCFDTVGFFAVKNFTEGFLWNALQFKMNLPIFSSDMAAAKFLLLSMGSTITMGVSNLVEAYLFFLLESPIIPKKYTKIGPEYFREQDCKSFISKNIADTQLMWINEDRKIVSLEKRKNFEAGKFLKEFLKNSLQTGIPKGLQGDFKSGFKVFLGTKNLSKSIKEVVKDFTSTDGTIFHSD